MIRNHQVTGLDLLTLSERRPLQTVALVVFCLLLNSESGVDPGVEVVLSSLAKSSIECGGHCRGALRARHRVGNDGMIWSMRSRRKKLVSLVLSQNGQTFKATESWAPQTSGEKVAVFRSLFRGEVLLLVEEGDNQPNLPEPTCRRTPGPSARRCVRAKWPARQTPR